MTTNEIRTKFLDFFKSQGHSIIASDSLVPKDDPTVLFTTAGMQQFKPQFLGHIDGFTRAATCQKCLRTDDLDVVGKTDFHHTFFEMLGNFSFGDYFKKDAIRWAWEFLTYELKLPKEKLWVSVYQEDEEAYGIWANEIKILNSRIIKLGDKSNFWPSNARLDGPNGPCGPCSEIFYDYGVNPKCPNGDKCNPECSCGRFSEVWNLVFTQFNRKDGGALDPLPAKNIDTGMGLERLAAVVQGKKSNYETDNFVAILKVIKEAFAANGAKATESEYRIIADHIRAVTLGIADGVMPSNEGRGYVMRKLIVDMSDLAIRAGIEKPVIYTFVDIVIERLRDPYPELSSKANEIKELIKRIEGSFIKVRRERVPELKEKIETAQTNFKELGAIFFLYRDTHGLTISTIHQVVNQVGVEPKVLNEAIKEFNARMEEQRNRSRAGSKMTGDVYANQDFTLNLPKTEFLGYKETKADAKVLKILIDEQGESLQAFESQWVKIVLDHTPFYAEAGGQVGDTGYLTNVIPAKAGIQKTGSPIKTFGDDRSFKVQVTDTRKVNDVYFHSGIVREGNIKTGDKVQAMIDEPRRRAIMRNHTATHLLQAALRETLGTHIKQQGSLVEEGRFRFDFTHPKGVKPEEIKKIENRVDEFIRRADPVTTEVLALEVARKKGALAFFAEKYGQTVRVISIGDYSREFCGGTHVSSTAEIEAMKIVSEGSVAQGIRRIEALTGNIKVKEFLKKQAQEASAVEEAQRMKQEEKSKQKIYFEKLKSSVDEMIKAGKDIKGATLIISSVGDIDIELLRKLSDLLKQKVKSGVFILGAKGLQDASVILSVTDDLAARGIKANELMQEIAPLLDGSGGGRANLAQAGSKQPQKLEGALAKASEIVSIAMTQKV
jgi:alanyl-tRNA synthetase